MRFGLGFWVQLGMNETVLSSSLIISKACTFAKIYPKTSSEANILLEWHSGPTNAGFRKISIEAPFLTCAESLMILMICSFQPALKLLPHIPKVTSLPKEKVHPRKLTAKAPEDRPSQKKTNIPTIHFQVRTVSLPEGRSGRKVCGKMPHKFKVSQSHLYKV